MIANFKRLLHLTDVDQLSSTSEGPDREGAVTVCYLAYIHTRSSSGIPHLFLRTLHSFDWLLRADMKQYRYLHLQTAIPASQLPRELKPAQH